MADLDLTEAIEAVDKYLLAIGWGQGDPIDVEALLEAAVPHLERQIRQQMREELRAPMRRLRSALVAVVDRLDVPYDPDVAEVTPWTRFVKPAVKQLEVAIARGDGTADDTTDGDS